MHCYVEQIVAENQPAVIVFNLLGYQYVWGNDVTVLFTAAYDHDTKRSRPVYIVATGKTYTSLHDFFKMSHILEAVPIEFLHSTEEVVQRLHTSSQ